jgi:NAD(P)-dependent dehydrogenase (short-subunit alcohol dehydrogenase family)
MTTSKVILITGCSSGIGRATAIRLARAGHAVYATARRLESIADLAQYGCRLLALDVTDGTSAREAVLAVEGAEGVVDVLINNAGYGQSGAVEAVSLEAVRAQFDTNIVGYLRLAQLVLPRMRSQGYGRVINVGSVAGRVAMPGSGIYSASKHAIEAITDALRFEVGAFGIDVSLIQPGPIRTEFTASANAVIPPGLADVYGDYHEAVARADAQTDSSLLAGTAEAVAAAIERAVTARRPRARYRVTLIARLLPILRAALPDRAWDAFLRTQITRPAPATRRELQLNTVTASPQPGFSAAITQPAEAEPPIIDTSSRQV